MTDRQKQFLGTVLAAGAGGVAGGFVAKKIGAKLAVRAVRKAVPRMMKHYDARWARYINSRWASTTGLRPRRPGLDGRSARFLESKVNTAVKRGKLLGISLGAKHGAVAGYLAGRGKNEHS